MQNCNLARSLQFLRLDTHLTSVKCDCNGFAVVIVIAVPAGGAGGAIAPPSFEDLGKIKIFRAMRRKYLGKTIVFRAAI